MSADVTDVKTFLNPGDWYPQRSVQYNVEFICWLRRAGEYLTET